ncbi:MAG: hypothetical protein H0W76_15880 [Pyrinomonadaceae bacterium]|nr:hypothetical protein [Pyrinomonadaceae bacterium]
MRSLIALVMAVCLLAAPITVLAKKKGEKNFKRGMEHEAAQQWDKAAQEFALAVAALPSDVEYQLHYRRSLFNASQTFMQKGRALAEQGDFTGAYNAYRQAYGYDQVNELALAEMERMLRLQREKEGIPEPDAVTSRGGARATIAPTSATGSRIAAGRTSALPPDDTLPIRAEQLRIININDELEPLIAKLAEELDLNVVFDKDFTQVGKRKVNLKLRNTTTARALDYVFKSQGIFFQKLDRRTILVADQAKRQQYQELVLRTFYLYNIKPEEARNLVQQTLPAGQGRTPAAIYINPQTNSITIRDTPETIRIIGELLKGIDKERAEVVMDVAIYEVSRSDLERLGGQLGNSTQLGNLGGTSAFAIGAGGSRQVAQQALIGAAPTALGAAFLIPPFVLSALQSKTNTRLLSSTQLHAFDGEKSTTSVGRSVPIQTGATVNPYGGGTGTNPQQPSGGFNPGVFGGYGAPIIQYEQTGLELSFQPQVFPNLDVQIDMDIKSTEVEGTAGASNLTPIISKRAIKGKARVQNNRTMMLASIAQDKQLSGRDGIPILGLVPIIGRLFTTPRRDNQQSDIVITVTPRVLRAPNITPSDEELRKTGSMQSPATETLEALVRDADREDQLAAARKLPTNVSIQLPAAEPLPAFVPAPKALSGNVTPGDGNGASSTSNTSLPAVLNVNATSLPQPRMAFDTSAPIGLPAASPPTSLPTAKIDAEPATSAAELRLVPEGQEMRAGDKRRLMVLLKTDAPLGLATATLRFDPRVVAVRSVMKGAMFTKQTGAPTITKSIDPKGVLVVSLAPAVGGPPLSGEGVLLLIEIEAVASGESAISFDADKVHLIATDGRNMRTQVVQSKVKVN